MRRHPNPLHTMFRACREGGSRELRAAIAQGAPLNALDDNKKSPLFLALEYGHATCFELLVHAGADLAARGPWGATLLMAAADSGSERALALLLGLNVRDGMPAAVALAAKRGELSCLRLLLEAGATPTA